MNHIPDGIRRLCSLGRVVVAVYMQQHGIEYWGGGDL